MKLTPEQLQEIENLGGYFFTYDEVAIVLGLDADQLEQQLTASGSQAYQAYQRGKLRSKLELRKTILTQAKQGSGPAQTMAARILDELEARQL